MAWTTPRTYVVGELLTAADMNLYQRDNFEAVLPYGTTIQTYTPSLTASTTDPTLGSGSTQEGRYYRIGRQVFVHVFVQFGTSGTAAGSGAYELSLPVNIATDWFESGTARLTDDSTGTRRVANVGRQTASTVRLYVDAATAAVTDAAPWVWAASDSIIANLVYEAS